MTRYGFIGTGSMGSMLVRKFTKTGMIEPAGITASSKTGILARVLAVPHFCKTVPALIRL